MNKLEVKKGLLQPSHDSEGRFAKLKLMLDGYITGIHACSKMELLL